MMSRIVTTSRPEMTIRQAKTQKSASPQSCPRKMTMTAAIGEHEPDDHEREGDGEERPQHGRYSCPPGSSAVPVPCPS